jgi:hypothetical protein
VKVPQPTPASGARDARWSLAAVGGLGVVAGGALVLGLPVVLALGLYLVVVAGALIARLHAQGGWARGAFGSYAFAAAALALQLTLAFLDAFDMWLAGFTGFGATVGVVLAGCQPFLDRTHVPDPADDPPADGQPLRYEGRPLDRAGLVLLLLYSQVVVAANGLLTWHTFRSH